MEETCPIPYPERFHAAVDFVSNLPEGAAKISDEVRLLLYALYKQATIGPCNESRPWGWNSVETSKWESWMHLGSMSEQEAMRHYVQSLDDIQRDWWKYENRDNYGNNEVMEDYVQEENHEENPKEETVFSKKQETMEYKLNEAASDGSWSTPFFPEDKKPLPRYEHGVAVIGSKMYIIGGNSTGGKYLNDIWIFDFVTLEWNQFKKPNNVNESLPPSSSDPQELQQLPPLPPTLPVIAGHSVIVWKNSLLIVGGHVKSKDATADMKIRVFDLKSMTWSILEPSGKPPSARGGHSVDLVNGRLVIFGGEDVARRPLGDLHILDLYNNFWVNVETFGKIPSPRSGHKSTVYVDRFVLIFGGGSVANCYNDISLLDTETMRWYWPPIVGKKPSPRAGHAGSLLNDDWYMIGGGNNASGCTDMAYMDLNQLSDWVPEEEQCPELEWTIVGTIPAKSYLASEGMSLVSVPEVNLLVSFGGYNGKYSNAVSLFKPKVWIPDPSALTDENSTPLPDINGIHNPEKKLSGPFENSNKNLRNQIESPWSRHSDINSRTEENNKLLADKEAIAHEVSVLRRQLLTAQTTIEEKDRLIEELKNTDRQEKIEKMKLQTEIAEMKKEFEKITDLEKELELYRRREAAAIEQAKKTSGSSSSGGGGIWGWVSGQ